MAKSKASPKGDNNDKDAIQTTVPERGIIRTVLVFLAFHGIYVVFPFAFILTPFVLIYSGKIVAGSLFLATYILWFVISHPDERKSGRPWPWFENLPIFKFLFAYFPFSIIRGSPDSKDVTSFDAKGLYVFAVHPHGTLALNRGMFGFSTKTLWDTVFPGVEFRVLTATAALRLPVIREMWLWSFCIDASKSVARRALKNRLSLLLYPGGEREQMMTVRGKHRLYLKQRKGFVKIAIESGASLVPIYVFGETDLFEHSQFLIDFRMWLVKNLGVAIPLVYGQAGMLPYPTHVTAVVGEPIKVKQCDNPPQTLVDETHELYMKKLTELFDANKAKQGAPDAVLEIM